MSVTLDYYADLDLPNTCSIDDIKKQYRKLALQYHPDRNAGREEEFVPKFQAIQTAHEILGDSALKAKYDTDRRKAGLYPASRPTPPTPTPGNPYAANSAYPPPPRRTQPGQWQRPQAPQPPQPSATTPTGADRFTNFPRGAPTARNKDPAQDRTNMFRAWENMKNAQERQQQQFTPPSGQAPPPQPTPSRPRPPPRQDTRMPSEDEIRAGMNHRKPMPSEEKIRAGMNHRKAPPQFEPEQADRAQSAWSDFQQKSSGKQGINRSNTTRTPKKQGFDPNMPGSDERPAGGSGYAHRHRSEDFGRPQPGQPFPPPPPGPPPQSPLSPGASPGSHRPFGDPLRPFKSRETHDQGPQVPYSEGNRKRTPYTSFSGEKTPFARDSGDGLRRSASTRDAARLGANGAGAGRARSTSPLGRHQTTQGHPQPPADYSDSDASDGRPMSTTPDGFNSGTATPDDIGKRPGTAPHATTPFERPKKIPTPPSMRFNGSTNPFSAPPNADGTQSDSERPGMQQKTSNNMYVNNDPFKHDILNHSPFGAGQWASQMFGTHSTSRTNPPHMSNLPNWAIPSSVQPGRVKREPTPPIPQPPADEARPLFIVDVKFDNATPDQQAAYLYFRSEIEHHHGEVPEELDMDVFLKLASTAAMGQASGHTFVDNAVGRALSLYPSVAAMACDANTTNTFTDKRSRDDRFTFPINADHFTPNGKSRSEENINTKFSPEGWSGTFMGSPDYFAPPQPPTGKKPSSPRQRSGLRSATTQVPPTNGAPSDMGEMPPPPRPSTTDAQQQAEGTSGEVKFSKEQWEKTFQDSSWTWPPPPPKPPSPAKVAKARATGRKGGRPSARSATSGAKEQPHVVDEDDTVEVEGLDGKNENGDLPGDDGDAMDIDTTPPAQYTENVSEGAPTEVNKSKEPRMYSVPPSTWRQQQQQPQANGHHRKTSSRASAGDATLNTDLDDLANVEPITRSADGGLKNLSDLGSTLPFQSQPSAALPTHTFEPRKLPVPPIPKAPEPPTQLTTQSWHAYSQTFGAYLKAYHAFNNTMLQHFVSREHQAQARLSAGTGWLEATGDTSGLLAKGGPPSGFGSYLQGVREDEQVREAWGLGCERHGEACKGFERVREGVRRRVVGGGLGER